MACQKIVLYLFRVQVLVNSNYFGVIFFIHRSLKKKRGKILQPIRNINLRKDFTQCAINTIKFLMSIVKCKVV